MKLVRGGQGRSGEEIFASAVGWLVCAAVIVAVCVAAYLGSRGVIRLP